MKIFVVVALFACVAIQLSAAVPVPEEEKKEEAAAPTSSAPISTVPEVKEAPKEVKEVRSDDAPSSAAPVAASSVAAVVSAAPAEEKAA